MEVNISFRQIHFTVSPPRLWGDAATSPISAVSRSDLTPLLRSWRKCWKWHIGWFVCYHIWLALVVKNYGRKSILSKEQRL